MMLFPVIQGQAQILAASEALEKVRLTRVKLHEELCQAETDRATTAGLRALAVPMKQWREHARPAAAAAGSLAAGLGAVDAVAKHRCGQLLRGLALGFLHDAKGGVHLLQDLHERWRGLGGIRTSNSAMGLPICVVIRRGCTLRLSAQVFAGIGDSDAISQDGG